MIYKVFVDGDALHVWRVPDRKMVRRLWNLRPARNVLSVATPESVSGAFAQQSPETLTLYNWLYGDEFDRQAMEAQMKS